MRSRKQTAWLMVGLVVGLTLGLCGNARAFIVTYSNPMGPMLTPSPSHWSQARQQNVYWVGDTLQTVSASVHLTSHSENGTAADEVLNCNTTQLTDGLGGGPVDDNPARAIHWAAFASGDQTSAVSGETLSPMHVFTQNDVGQHTATCTFTYNYKPNENGQRVYWVEPPGGGGGQGPGGEGIPEDVLEEALLPTE